MIVCVCANVNERTLVKEIAQGKTLDELKRELEVCCRCCCCEKELVKLYNEVKENVKSLQ